MSTIEMSMLHALKWIKLAIEKEQYDTAISILDSIITQQEQNEKPKSD